MCRAEQGHQGGFLPAFGLVETICEQGFVATPAAKRGVRLLTGTHAGPANITLPLSLRLHMHRT